ncbi:MAG: DUF4097 family beta strand repeat-containing protein [Metallibacterium sp.]
MSMHISHHDRRLARNVLIALAACALALVLPRAQAAPTPSADAPSVPINITRPLAADGTVSIDNGAGSIQVIAWDKPEVRVTGQQPAAVKPPEVESSASRFTLRIRAKVEQCWLGFSCSTKLLPVHLTVYAPRGARLDLHAISADTRVQGMNSPRLDADGVSGDMTLSDARFAVARLHSVSGDMHLNAVIGRLDADNVSGDVRGAMLACGSVRATTVSGDISLGCARVSEAALKSVSGDLQLSLSALAPAGAVSLNTVSGDARLSVPAGVSARLDLGSLSGSIGGALPAGVTVQKHSVSGRFGSGDGSLRVQTVSGDIHLQQGG